MTRVALYARYSSDRQNERSIEDQFAVLTRHAEARGWNVVLTFSDAAISGAAMANRPGLNAALFAAQAGGFDTLLAEDEDRIARNLEHQAAIFNRLSDLGVAIATLNNDAIGIEQVALKGLLGELYLKNLSQKTRRGMQANAAAGRATGSRLYGYRSEPGGAMAIVEAEAEVVRRIFQAYADGETPRAIAEALNRERVPSPRGGLWNASTINGSRQRGNGILNTELYAGVKVWGRIDMRKDRTTGQRISVPLPPEQWKRTPVPHLRLVPEEVWEAARDRKIAVGEGHPTEHRRAPSLFGGLYKCRCGATYTGYRRGELRCAANREQGDSVCPNRRTVSREALDQRVLEGLTSKLLSPEAVAEYVRAYRDHMKRRQAEAVDLRLPLTKRLGETTRTIERLVDKICDGSDTPATTARLKQLEAEKLAIEAELAGLAEEDAENVIALHPNAPRRWAEKVAELRQALDAAAVSPETSDHRIIDQIRPLVDRIEVLPAGPNREDPIDVVLHGRLAAILEGEHIENRWRGKVVAGARYIHSPPISPPCGVRLPLRRIG